MDRREGLARIACFLHACMQHTHFFCSLPLSTDSFDFISSPLSREEDNRLPTQFGVVASVSALVYSFDW